MARLRSQQRQLVPTKRKRIGLLLGVAAELACIPVLLHSARGADAPRALFSLSEEALPSELTAALVADEIPDLSRLLSPAAPGCRSAEAQAPETMCQAQAASTQARLTAETRALNAELEAKVATRLKALPAGQDLPLPESGMSCAAEFAEDFEQLDRLKRFLAAPHAPSETDVAFAERWIQGLSAEQMDKELSEKRLALFCKEKAYLIASPVSRMTEGILRERFLRNESEASAWLENQCQAGVSAKNFMRELWVWAHRSGLDLQKIGLEHFNSIYEIQQLKAGARAAPAACGKPESLPPLARGKCACADSLTRSWEREEANQLVRDKLGPKIRERFSRVRDWISRTRLSQDAKTALLKALDPDKASITGFASEVWNAVMNASEQEFGVSTSLVAALKQPELQPAIEATLTHEIGHYVAFLFQGGKVDCQSFAGSKCDIAREVAAALSPKDLERLTNLRDCMDRNALLGEWKSAQPRLEEPDKPTLSRVISKREEYFADFVMRGALRSPPPPPQMSAFGFICPLEGLSLRDYLHDSHGEPLFRIATAANPKPYSPTPSAEPPLACEGALEQ